MPERKGRKPGKTILEAFHWALIQRNISRIQPELLFHSSSIFHFSSLTKTSMEMVSVSSDIDFYTDTRWTEILQLSIKTVANLQKHTACLLLFSKSQIFMTFFPWFQYFQIII